MLAVERGAPLIFRAHNPLDRCKIQLAKRIILTAEQALSLSTVLKRVGPYVHHLAAYERLDGLRAVLGINSQPVHVMRAIIDSGLHERHRISPLAGLKLFSPAPRELHLPHRPTATKPRCSKLHRDARRPEVCCKPIRSCACAEIEQSDHGAPRSPIIFRPNRQCRRSPAAALSASCSIA